jgi:hypothetical protein
VLGYRCAGARYRCVRLRRGLPLGSPAHVLGFDSGNFEHVAEKATAFVPRHRGEFSRHRADVIDGGPAIRLALLWHSTMRVHVYR